MFGHICFFAPPPTNLEQSSPNLEQNISGLRWKKLLFHIFDITHTFAIAGSQILLRCCLQGLNYKKKKMPWPLNTLCQYNHFWWTLIDMRSEWPQQMWCYLANGWHCSNITYDKECLSVWCEHGCPSHNLWTIQQSDLVGLLLSTQSSAVLSVKSFIHQWVFLDNAASSHITVVEASISSGGQAINKCSERPHLNRHYTRIIK